MSIYYVDSSAALKLVVEEEHSQAFGAFYDSDTTALWMASDLLRIEVMRTVTRFRPTAVPTARALLSAFDYITMDEEIADTAMGEPGRMLRSLDAIHLATARLFVPELDGIVTYDDRLAAAATEAGFTVISPRD